MGTCLSQFYDQYDDSDSRKPLIDETTDTVPQQYQ
jgi:hypothetical protein